LRLLLLALGWVALCATFPSFRTSFVLLATFVGWFWSFFFFFTLVFHFFFFEVII
jgi:hypothetical protein